MTFRCSPIGAAALILAALAGCAPPSRDGIRASETPGSPPSVTATSETEDRPNGRPSLPYSVERTEAVPLRNGRLRIRQEDGTVREVPVTLSRVVLNMSADDSTNREARQVPRGYPLLLVLRSADPQHPFEWATGERLAAEGGLYGLFSDATGSYLGWATGYGIGLADVSKAEPLDQYVLSHPMDKPPSTNVMAYVSLRELLPAVAAQGRDALFREANIDTVGHNPAGELEVSFHGPDKPMTYTIVSADLKQWRLK